MWWHATTRTTQQVPLTCWKEASCVVRTPVGGRDDVYDKRRRTGDWAPLPQQKVLHVRVAREHPLACDHGLRDGCGTCELGNHTSNTGQGLVGRHRTISPAKGIRQAS